MISDLSRDQSITDLIHALHHPDKKRREAAVSSLVTIGKDAVYPLTSSLRDNDWKVRYRAAEVLGLMQASDAVADLIPLTEDTKDHVRYMASKSLGLIGERSALPALEPLLNDEHEYTRGITAESLAAIGDRHAIPLLEAAVHAEKIPQVQKRMYRALLLLKKEISG